MIDDDTNFDNDHEEAKVSSGSQRRREELDHEARRRLEQRLEVSWIHKQTQDYDFDLD
jgi:hypothetical protein